MIDYEKINKDISQSKWNRIHSKSFDKFSCYYDEHNHHELCPHQEHCILNQEFLDIHAQISQDKQQKKLLEDIYHDVVELKSENPEKKFSEMYVGFDPKQNRIDRAMLNKNIQKNYNKLKTLKTKKGGY